MRAPPEPGRPEPGTPQPGADAARRLREDLLAAAYTVEGVLGVLGPGAYSALGRGDTVPALAATSGGSPCETLTRLFVLQTPVPARAGAAAVADVDGLVAGGVLQRDGGQLRARVDAALLASVLTVSDDVRLRQESMPPGQSTGGSGWQPGPLRLGRLRRSGALDAVGAEGGGRVRRQPTARRGPGAGRDRSRPDPNRPGPQRRRGRAYPR